MEIRNEDLQKLVKNEAAKEFNVRGISSDSFVIWEYDTSLKEVPEEEEENIEEDIEEEHEEDIEEVKVDVKEVENPAENES